MGRRFSHNRYPNLIVMNRCPIHFREQMYH